jgi:hypothetical protein
VVNNWRSEWPAAALRGIGIDAHAFASDGDVQEADIAPGDTVVVHASNQGDTFAEGFRQLAPFLEVIRNQAEPRLLVVQWDDSYFDLEDIQDTKGKGWYRALMEDTVASARVADRVIVTTPYLAEKFQPYNLGTYIVPNYIATWVTELDLPDTLGHRAVWLGALGGIPEPGQRKSSHFHDWMWTSPFPEDIPLKVVGIRSHAEHRWFSSWCKDFTYARATSDLERLYREVADGTCVGIAPVDASLGFNRAKSWIKPMEYAALGLHSVVAPTDEYRALEMGAICEAPDFWDGVRDRIGLYAGERRHRFLREWVRERFTVEANVEVWRRALDL